MRRSVLLRLINSMLYSGRLMCTSKTQVGVSDKARPVVSLCLQSLCSANPTIFTDRRVVSTHPFSVTTYRYQACRVLKPIPAWRLTRSRVHHGQVTSTSHRDKQPFPHRFTPMGSLMAPIKHRSLDYGRKLENPRRHRVQTRNLLAARQQC